MPGTSPEHLFLIFIRNQEKVLREEKQTELERIREAFGVSKDAREGDAFKFESEKDRQARLAQYAEEERRHRNSRR